MISAIVMSSVVLLPHAALGFWKGPTLQEKLIRLHTGKEIAIPKRTIEFPARPVDFVLSKNGQFAYVKTDSGITVVDLQSGQYHSYPIHAGTSQLGIALSQSGKRLACSDAGSGVELYRVNGGEISFLRAITLQNHSAISGPSYPCGLTFSSNGNWLYVCLSRDNAIAKVNITTGKFRMSPTDVAPFGVVLFDNGKMCAVTCLSTKHVGHHPAETTSGTLVPVDRRGIARHGELCLIQTRTLETVKRLKLGLLPGQPVIFDGRILVPDANSDAVTSVSTQNFQIKRVWRVAKLTEFGASPNALAGDLHSAVAVACGGANQVRFFTKRGKQLGSLNTPDYPIAIAIHNNQIVVACTNGVGNSTKEPSHFAQNPTPSFTPLPATRATKSKPGMGYSVFDSLGSISVIDSSGALPSTKVLSRQPKSEKPDHAVLPPQISHVIYIIKENRTYDQVLGDTVDGDSYLVNFGKKVTPNEHRLAKEFGTLTRYFCDSVISTDGHAWSTEANSTAYLERSFGGWTRSYPWGDDPLAISSSGAIWDDALDHGKTVRNYGEYVYANLPPKMTWTDCWNLYQDHKPLPWTPSIQEKRLWSVSDHHFPGWNLTIPDQVRADEFIKDFHSRIKKGKKLADLTVLYLEQDHTSGEAPGMPTPCAMNADNDEAVGRVVDAVSHSKYWKSTAIFIIEDDPQDGYDHIDGHRSICLVVSPYSRGMGTNRTYYDQASVLRTIEAILKIPPMTRFDRNAPIMANCFQRQPNLQPYTALNPQISLTTLNRPGAQALQFDYPDESDDLALNQQIWHSVYPNREYPYQDCPPSAKQHPIVQPKKSK